MSYNIDRMIDAGDIEMMHRVRRYDVEWGHPPYAIGYKRMSFSKMPAYYWSMENSGTGSFHTTNLGYTGTSFNATYAGSPTFAPGQADPTDNAAFLDSVAYATADSVSLIADFQTGYTVTAMIKPTTMPGSYEKCIVSKSKSNGAGMFTLSIYQSGNNIFLKAWMPGGQERLTNDVAVPLGEWSHVAMVVEPLGNYTGGYIGLKRARYWDTCRIRFYLNGVMVSEKYATNATPIDDTSAFVIGAYRVANVVYTPSSFCGALDEVAITPNPLNPENIRRLAEIGSGLVYFEPDQDYDSDVIGSYLVPVKYDSMIYNDKASAYWSLDARKNSAGQYYAFDGMGTRWTAGPQHLLLLSSSATDPAWFSSTNTGIHSSNKDGTEFGAIKFGGRGQQGTRNGIQLYTPDGALIPYGSYSAFSMELWYQPGGASRDMDGIIGCPNADYGVVIAQHGDFNINVFIQRPSSAGGTITFQYDVDLTLNSWYHIALTVTSTGETLLYINGVAQVSRNIGTGVRVPTAGAFFCVGSNNYGGNFDDVPAFWADEIALYGYALTPEQVTNHYLTGVNGPYRRHRLTGGDPDNPGASYTLNANEYSLLINEEDISEHVGDYNIDYDLKQVVSTGTMGVYEEWGEVQIATKLRANTYVIFERRYLSASLNTDSGWLSVGHMFVEGPMGDSIQAGKKTITISLKGIGKLYALDSANVPIEPDKLLMRRRVLDYRESTVEWTKFKLNHPTVAGGFYENWAEFPSVRMWVTDFGNIGDGNKGGVQTSTEILRIKGSEGAVKVLGGEGAIVIDNDFLNSAISDSGLGRPSTVLAEFWRYARPYDITTHQITSIVYNQNTERWDVVLNNYAGELDGKTVFMRSGNAKGKIFRIRQPWLSIDGLQTPLYGFDYAAGSTVTSVTRTGANYPDFSLQQFESKYCAAVNHPVSTALSLTKLLKIQMAYTGNVANIPDTAKLVGIKAEYTKRVDASYSVVANAVDKGIYIKFATGYQTSTLDQLGYWPVNVWTTTTVGGKGQLFGLPTNVLWSTVKTWTATEFYLGASNRTDTTLIAFWLAFSGVKITLMLADDSNTTPILYLVDMNEYPINPPYENMAVGDTVQVGDFNRIEDALRKVSVRSGYQELDSTYPFYMDFDPCPAVLAPSVAPLRSTIFDGVSWMDVVDQILDAAPPNYRLIEKSNGVMKAQLFGFVPGAIPAHTIKGAIDLNQDTSDYGVATRVIARGQSSTSINIALNMNAGGTSACRAYTLNGYASATMFSMGRTVSQTEADSIWRQVFNGNPKSPVPTLSDDWKKNNLYTYYGTILWAYNTISNVKRWTYEDIDLCAIDIGRSTNGSEIEIEAVEFTWFNNILEGNTLGQTMYVYYMTEAGYQSVYGVPPPNTPNDSDTTYFPPADSSAWKLLLDEFALTEGQTTLESTDFVAGVPTKVRFLKFVVGQAHYRFPLDRDPEKDRAQATVNMAEIKVYTSRNIVATAELGNVPPFDSAEHKELATRIRRRTDVLDVNIALDSYDKARNYSISELLERFNDFTPFAVVGFAPTVELGDIVRLIHPETLASKTYIVMAVSQPKNGVAKMQCLNYDLLL